MGKSTLVLAILLVLSFSKTDAQNYSAESIPDSLKENAHCIIRDYTVDIELKSINKGVEKIKRVLTILDKEGDRKARLFIPYDKNSHVSIDQVILYDARGKKIRKVKDSEIVDSPVFSSFELYSDCRVKFINPEFAEYPFTVEYDYEISSSNMVSYGYWNPVDDYNMSIENSRLTVTYPTSVKINRKEVSLSRKSRWTRNEMVIESWYLSNFKAIEDEPFDVSISERTPGIYLMPAVLNYNNYTGTANTWEEYGVWANKLYEGRDELSDADKQKVTTLVKDLPDTLERIKTIYKYMQENTRYVAVEMGIGGYQPFDAMTVSKTGYGDCKALSNYMRALLKVIGVKSYSSLVSSGRYIVSVFPDFPNFQQFDHVILCIPYQKDTIWLECTDQKQPFGFLGDFTDDRDVLLITESGGRFAHTKKYGSNENLRKCTSHFMIDSMATATGSLKTIYQGLQYDDVFELLWLNHDEQKKWLYKKSALPSSQITDFSINNNRSMIPVAKISESVISRNYASFSGRYMLLPLNLTNAQKPIQKMLKSRNSDIVINRSSVDYDTLMYQIPQNYKFESVPAGKTIESKFGSYSYSVSVNGNEITYTRKLLMKQGRYNPSAYKELYEFILSVSKADNMKVMLTRTL
ncbi:MAG: DUF3857 domain-containing protein [Bacteroidetes bacterium]|nr:DUF3857 domain-containing protein [Bacteroidota bacterium]